MKIPFSSELLSGIIRWPVFLLANKVVYSVPILICCMYVKLLLISKCLSSCSLQFLTALSMARDFVGKDANLLKKIKKDDFMYFAVKECYESLKNILEILVVGDLETR